MKKLFLFLTMTIFLSGKAQITPDHTYPGNSISLYLDKFHVSGYKYVEITTNQINIYNLNHSIFKTINIPAIPGNKTISYVSENLFDTDNLIEFAMGVMVVTQSTVLAGPTSYIPHLYIFKENGTQLFSKDSAAFVSNGLTNSFSNGDNIFSDGTSTKMKVAIQQGSSGGVYSRTIIYTLPGTIPCIQCSSSGAVTGIEKNERSKNEDAIFYPNPVLDELKLKYELPKEAREATIKIQDLQGKLVGEFKVSNSFDYLLLPSNYNNGLYLYSLIVDGKTIKTEKIILNK